MTEPSTAVATREESTDLTQPSQGGDLITRMVAVSGMPETIVKMALGTVFAGKPAGQIAIALSMCAKYGLDPLAKEVEIIDTQAGPRPYITLDGRLKLAAQHPDYAGVGFANERTEGNDVLVDVFLYRKSWPTPTLPSAVGRYKKTDVYAIEKARARGVRTAIRYAFGLHIPDEDEQMSLPDVPARQPLRPDQRRTLFVSLRALGWDRDERLAWSSRVLNRNVTTWSGDALSERDGALLLAALEPIVDQLADEDVPPQGPSQAPQVQRGEHPHPTEAVPKDTPRSSVTEPSPADASEEVQQEPKTAEATPDTATASVTAPAALDDAWVTSEGEAPPADALQLVTLAEIAKEMGWDERTAIARASRSGHAPLSTLGDLTARAATTLEAEWGAMRDKHRDNRRSRLKSACAKRSLDLDKFVAADELERLTIPELNAVLKEIEEYSARAEQASLPVDERQLAYDALQAKLKTTFVTQRARLDWVGNQIGEVKLEDLGAEDLRALTDLLDAKKVGR